MVKIHYSELKLNHIVIFKHEDTVFACGREGNGNGSTSLTTGGKTRLFLVFGNGEGRVYARNGRAESWELLKEQDADKIRRSLELARENNIPTYLLNGSCKQLVA